MFFKLMGFAFIYLFTINKLKMDMKEKTIKYYWKINKSIRHLVAKMVRKQYNYFSNCDGPLTNFVKLYID